jgi:hypothetical protein
MSRWPTVGPAFPGSQQLTWPIDSPACLALLAQLASFGTACPAGLQLALLAQLASLGPACPACLQLAKLAQLWPPVGR